MEKGIYRVDWLMDSRNEFRVVHQARKTDESTGETYWETLDIQPIEWNDDMKRLFGRFHLVFDGLMAQGDWIYPNDTKYRINVQVRIR